MITRPLPCRRLAALTLAVTATLFGTMAQAAAFADQIYVNGVVYTVDANDSVQQAVAIRHGRIMAVGSDAQIRALAGPTTRTVDLAGNMMLPGLVDAHLHPLGGGAMLRSCSLGYEPLDTAAIGERIRQCLKSQPLPAGAWLQVQAWFRQGMPAGTDLSAAALDAIDASRPIVVVSTDHHTLAANSAAMRAAKVSAATVAPSNGKIVRLPDGQPSGIFEDGAMENVMRALPPLPAAAARAQRRDHALAALSALNAQGVTTFLDAAADPDGLQAFTALRAEGKLTARAHFAPVITPDQARQPEQAAANVAKLAKRYHQPRVDGQPDIRLTTAKIFMDGVIQAPAQTAALHLPYLHNHGSEAAPDWRAGDKRGELYFDQAKLNRLVLALARHQLTPHLHTDGDQAVTVALNAVETLRQTYPGVKLRPALAHNELVRAADYPRYRQLDALPILSFQWGKPAADTLDTVKPYIGHERFPYLETAGKFQQAGATVAFGSDWPVDPLNEWFALQIAVTRANPAEADRYPGRLGDDPGLTVPQAIRAFTYNAAYSLGREKEIGSIEAGKWADLIVLDRNLLKIPATDIQQVKVLSTVLAGKEVYRQP